MVPYRRANTELLLGAEVRDLSVLIPARNEMFQGKRESDRVSDGQVTPACAQTCPTQAIVFGDIRDSHSRVAQVTQNERGYRVLDEHINTQPAVTYLKKVTFHDIESGEH